MRAARLIHLVLLLQSRGTVTATELAERLEVSTRTVTRDVQALSEAGVPVYAERGRCGGYRLVGGYRTRLTGLGRTEAETLFLSGVPSALREMGLADVASAARLKVSAALLPELSDASDSAAQRFHLDAPGWWQSSEPPELLPAVAGAVWEDRWISARYRRRDGEGEVERRLEPYGLVLKAGVWYLVARVAGECATRDRAAAERAAPAPPPAGGATGAAGTGPGTAADGPGTSGGGSGAARRNGAAHATPPGGGRDRVPPAAAGPGQGAPAERGGREFRVYRVDRFTAVTADRECFARDQDFDLPGFWDGQAAAFARSILRERVVVRLSPEGARRLRYVTDRTAADEAVAAAGDPDEQGRITVVLPVESPDVAYTQLLALGPEAEVLRPPELRARCAESAARSHDLYAR